MYHTLTINDNHLCVRLPSGDWLVDTGSPITFGETPVVIGKTTYDVASTFPSFSLEKLREYVGPLYVGLLGVDILNRYVCHFDIPNQRMGFLDNVGVNPQLRRVPLDILPGGVPVLNAELEDEIPHRLIFDTGAQYSYLNKIKGDDVERIGRGTDFHPMLGRFPIEFFMKKLAVGSFDNDLQFSTQPLVTQMSRLLGTDGILGLEPLRTHQMFYNPKGKEIWI
jgi:hypothetical protein